MAQLVAHHTGSVGVRGSSPLSSTKGFLIEPLAWREPMSMISADPSGSAELFSVAVMIWRQASRACEIVVRSVSVCSTLSGPSGTTSM